MKLIYFSALIGLAGGLYILLKDRRFRITRMKNVHIRFVKAGSTASEGMCYGSCRLSPLETAAWLAAGGALGFAVGYLFYHHIVPAGLCSLIGLRAPHWRRRMRIRKQKEELGSQFKQALYAMVSSLTAGRAVENTFAAAVKDLRLVYTDPNTFILVEFERIDRKIANGETVEAALEDFGRRSELEELLQFTEVFTTCKRTGGNLAEVMRRTAHMIGEKMEVRQEIQVMLAQKRFESKVLGAAPMAVIGLLYWSTPDYMAPLYGNPAGVVIMTCCLGVFAGCWRLTGKWMELKL
jgi:tight adherence protein B